MAILYKGPSLLNGEPIVAIATMGSKNPKTGDMIQVWIIPAKVAPTRAVKNGKDFAVCGDCPQRHYLGGACYVKPYQAPLSVYKAFRRGNYGTLTARKLAKALHEGKHIRLGAYGDPCAVPLHVWDHLLDGGKRKHTGYTHQWRNPRFQEYRRYLMASADSPKDADDARNLGWRYFRVTKEGDPVMPREFVCMSERERNPLTCNDCMACDGTGDRAHLAASVRIQVHGALSNRFRLNVIQ